MGEFDHLLNDQGQIKDALVDDLLVEVISGKSLFTSAGELYASRSPTFNEQDQARIIYTRRLFETRKTLPTRDQLEIVAVEKGIFIAEEREEVASLEGLVARHIRSRENTRDPKQKVELAAEIVGVRERIMELRAVEGEVFAHSAESKAENTRTSFMVSCCTLQGELLDKPVWGTWEEFQNSINVVFLNDSRRAFLRAWHGLPIKIIRAIARTAEWRGRWKAALETNAPVFDGSPSSWDASKRNLTWWSDFYDTVYRHPQAPGEEIIANDEALQKWMNLQIAKNKQGPKAPDNRPPRTFTDGRGRHIPSVKVGEETIAVNTPYRV